MWRLVAVSSFYLACLFVVEGAERTFEIDYDNDRFLKDGKPYRYIGGEIHYFRIHPSLWNDRLQRYRAAGLNAALIYIPWNFHEPYPGKFNFAGDRNVTKFIMLAQKNQLDVILRIGPYACGEWEFGGFPWWLPSIPGIQLRTYNDAYIKAVRRYFDTLLEVIKPLMHKNGGPVIMVQIENEYGSVSSGAPNDRKYLRFLRDEVRSKLGNDTVLYTTDGADDNYLKHGSIEGVYPTVDFAPGYDVPTPFRRQRKVAPKGPLVNSEFYPGWFMQWGGVVSPSYQTPEFVVENVKQMYALNASFSIYMFHGGTNFGFWNGAERWDAAYEHTYTPQITTSYDYNAPISETGGIREYFLAIRNFTRSLPNWPTPPLAVPKNHSSFSVTGVKTTRIGGLLELFTESTSSKTCRSSKYPLTFEDISHPFGYVVYSTHIPNSGQNMNLSIPEIHDGGFVYVDGVFQGYLQRLINHSLVLENVTKGQQLSIIVENQGRFNFPLHADSTDFKGLLSNVTLDGQMLTVWTQCGVDLDILEQAVAKRLHEHTNDTAIPGSDQTSPGVWAAEFKMEPPGALNHSFWDSDGWGKGQFILNGFNLGRYWPGMGPQITLYTPGALFKKKNTAIVVELLGCQHCDELNYVAEPIYRASEHPKPPKISRMGRWDKTV